MKSSIMFFVFASLEKVMGREKLWRFTRALFFHVRRDGNDNMETSGEYNLHRIFSNVFSKKSDAVTIVDVGANIGYWAKHLLDECQGNGINSVNYYGFEPSDIARNQLKATLSNRPKNQTATFFPKAVAATIGTCDFDNTEGLSGSKSLLTNSPEKDIKNSKQVDVTTLDIFASEAGIKEIDFLKCDVEGYDLEVIRGAIQLLKAEKIGVFQFEYNATWIETRYYIRDVFKLIEELPYALCRVIPAGLESYENWNPQLETYFHTNFVLVKKSLMKDMLVTETKFNQTNTPSIIQS